jgi:hypothetical protein
LERCEPTDTRRFRKSLMLGLDAFLEPQSFLKEATLTLPANRQ